ncbi:MAG TPA: acylphosphatase [Steroidobacteraceae bacterium]|jgi:acylphosphatase|nr:acylphosphatase [Steroidobacteraceae bacterium]
MRVGRRCVVSGRVQGVFYRASARQRAQGSGVTGYAKNLSDGSVEVLACGEEAAVLEFIRWLWTGPSAAKVADVKIETVEFAPDDWPPGFRTS